MLNKVSKVICYLSLILFTCSCSSIKSKHFVGEKMDCLTDLIELQENEGLTKRKMPDSAEVNLKCNDKYFKVHKSGDKYLASSLRWDKKKKKYVTESIEIIISQLDKNLFLNIKEDGAELYTILRASLSFDHGLIVFPIDKDEIEKDIKTGKIRKLKTEENEKELKLGEMSEDDFLKSIISDNSISLDLSKKELDKYIKSNVNRIFNYNFSNNIEFLD